MTLIAVAIPVIWLGLIAKASFSRSAEQQNMAQGVANCRQIITAIRTYSSEHSNDPPQPAGKVQEPSSANEAFRVLFKENIVNNESIFGCPLSPYQPDGNHGTAPDFKDALAPGENHWMMTSGVSDSASGGVPLVYENAEIAQWNPEWNADAKGKAVPGRAWSKGIIIGLNDASVNLQPLAAQEGTSVRLKNRHNEEKNAFTVNDLDGLDWEVLDVERKPAP